MEPEKSLLQWVRASGVDPIREGKVWICPCPFHDDSGRSLMIDPEKNHWQCDGDCQTGGSIIDWVTKIKHVSVTHAQELLRHEHPLLETAPFEEIGQTTVRTLDAPFSLDDDDQTVLQQVISYYHKTLKQSPDALTYLKGRGVDKAECIDHFKIGFSNRTLGYHLPAKNRKDGAALRGRLQRLGILRANGHEHFRGSIVIPIINNGIIEDIYGRKIAKKLRPGTPHHCRLGGERNV